MTSHSLAANAVCAKAKEAQINTRANQRFTRRSMLALLYRKSNRSQCAAPRCPPLPFDKGRGLRWVRSRGGRLSEQTLTLTLTKGEATDPHARPFPFRQRLECNELTCVFKVRLTRHVLLLETGN